MKHYQKKGFTLAEVLVTLGIIGVVSAMTIPTLMNNYQRQTYVAQLHKFYNEMSQALMQFQTDRNGVNLRESGLSSQAATDTFMKQYLKVVNDCGADATPCMSAGYRKLDGGVALSGLMNTISLASGASFSYSYVAAGNRVVSLDVDINGTKGPNVAGRDLFALYIYNNGIIDDQAASAPLTREQRDNNFTSFCNSATPDWYGCFGKIINDNWQMTY